MGRLTLNLLASISEFELELIRERVKAGIDRAMKTGTRSGHPIGRPRARIPFAELSDAYRRTGSVRAAARAVGCKPATAWDRLNQAGLLVSEKGYSDSIAKSTEKTAVSQRISFPSHDTGQRC